MAEEVDVLAEDVQDAPSQAEFDALVLLVAENKASIDNMAEVLADTKSMVESINFGKLRADINRASSLAMEAEQVAYAW